jgi:hypothetical protein
MDQQQEMQQQGAAQAAPEQAPADANPLQRVIFAAMKVIYTKQTSDGVVKMLRSGEPATAIAQTCLFVMKALFDESKATIPKEVMIPAALSVIELLAEIAQAVAVEVDEAAIEKAKAIVQQTLAKTFGAPAQQEQPAPGAEEAAAGEGAAPQEGLISNARAAQGV